MQIGRIEAQQIIAETLIDKISNSEVLSILSEYWIIGTEDDFRAEIEEGNFPPVSDEVIKEIIESESPLNPDRIRFRPLLLDMLTFQLNKVKNTYLEGELNKSGSNYKIDGIPEKSGICPCCLCYSIDFGVDGFSDICPVCFWENGGDGPNHMTLKEAQINFKKLGGINERSLQFVDPDGLDKYERS